jgi:hypothetical protein
VEATGLYSETRPIEVVNKSDRTLRYDVSYNASVTTPGVSYSVLPESIRLAPHGSTVISVTLTADAALMRHTTDPTVIIGTGRSYLTEASGYVVLTPLAPTLTVNIVGDGSVLQVPQALTYTYGTTVTLTAAAGAQSYFAGWSGDVVSQTNPIEISMDGDKVVTATFSTYSIYLPLIIKTSSAMVAASFDRAAAESAASLRLPTVLRVPVHAIVRPSSQMQTAQTVLDFTTFTTTTISPIGQGLNTGSNYPTDTLSLLGAFELAEAWPNDPGKIDRAELKYLGVGNNFGTTGSVTTTTLYFAIAAQDDWSVPVAPEAQFKIFIDADRNGTDDFVLYNDTLNGQANDVFYSRLTRLSNNATSYSLPLNVFAATTYDVRPFNTNVLILGVPASALGLTSINPTFRYRAESYTAYGLVAASAVHTYTASTPGLDFSGGLAGTPLWSDLPSTSITVRLDPSAFTAYGSLGAVVWHLHNASPVRTEVLTVIAP